jgi:16S rRNA (guanine1207-N2)-methyltransferase
MNEGNANNSKNKQHEHYYSKDPTSAERPKSFKFNFKNIEFTFNTSSGIFSKDKPDLGSIVLLKAARPIGKVLDLGCGYGLIGIILKKMNPTITMTCSDINSRAVRLTKENADLNHVDVNCIQSDFFMNLKESFDTVIVNLPLNAGKEVCFKMITESFMHLEDNGTLQVVARHQKGGKQYELKMKDVFGNVNAISKESGYRVYLSIKIGNVSI